MNTNITSGTIARTIILALALVNQLLSVTYNGKIYESTMNGNVYSPDAYPQGWKEVEA